MSDIDFDGFDDDLGDDEKPSPGEKRRKRKLDEERDRAESHRYKPEHLTSIPWPVCEACGGPPEDGQIGSPEQWQRVCRCEACDGVGYVDVPTDVDALLEHEQGSDARIVMLSQRRSAGFPDLFEGITRSNPAWDAIFLTPETEF